MSSPMTNGHLYRVGKDWYADTALLQHAARRHVVEPMQGAYQILAPAGLVRCAPAQGLALPGQSGDLFRCQGRRGAQDIAPIVRDLATSLGPATIGGEWESWPADAAASGHACGCTACKAGGVCRTDPADHPHHEDSINLPSIAARLIASEGLGAVTTRTTGEQLEVYPWKQGAMEWACGRYHECIGSILQFPDLDHERIARVTFRPPRTSITWDVVLDRQRRLMLQEILELVGRQLGLIDREGAVRPGRPPMMTPGFHAWELAARASDDEGSCSVCPYRLGTNLRCQACRRRCLGRKSTPAVDQARRLADLLTEHEGLRNLPRATLRSLGTAIAASHGRNPYVPLTDAFFVRLERDVLGAAGPLGLGDAAIFALVETAEVAALHGDISLGAMRRSA
jgi:hypothetical protein